MATIPCHERKHKIEMKDSQDPTVHKFVTPYELEDEDLEEGPFIDPMKEVEMTSKFPKGAVYEDDGVLKLSELERMLRSKSMQIRRIRCPEEEGSEVSDELGKAIA